MVRHVGNLMARAGGGDGSVLEHLPRERPRFIQMAGVLFTTSGIAVLSMTFALHDAVGAPLAAAIILGLLWGAVIFNLDRFLVISMRPTRKVWHQVGIMAPRFAMAVLLAAVISTPLVLRIFASDIKEELSIIQQQRSAQFAALSKNSADGKKAAQLEAEIQADQAILNGHLPQSIESPQLASLQAQVTKLQPEAQSAYSAETTAYEAWQCELNGQHCAGSSGVPGNGALAHTKYQVYQTKLAAYNNIESQLQSAESAESAAQKSFGKSQGQRVVQLQQQARNALPGLQAQYATFENRIQGSITANDNTNKADTGILAQIQALDEASSQNSGLAAVRWTVLGLFFFIEILPVTVKFLVNLGSLSEYDRFIRDKEESDADARLAQRVAERRMEEINSQARISLEERKSEAHIKIEDGKTQTRINVEQDMRAREEDLGKQANQYVADEVTKILDRALQEWGKQVRAKLADFSHGQNGNDQGSNGSSPPPGEETASHYGMPDGGNL